MEAKKFYTSKKSRINTSEKKVLPNVMPTKKNLTLFLIGEAIKQLANQRT